LKQIAIASGIAGLLGLILLINIKHILDRKAKQSHYLWLYIICLFGCFACTYLAWNACYQIKYAYGPHRKIYS